MFRWRSRGRGWAVIVAAFVLVLGGCGVEDARVSKAAVDSDAGSQWPWELAPPGNREMGEMQEVERTITPLAPTPTDEPVPWIPSTREPDSQAGAATAVGSPTSSTTRPTSSTTHPTKTATPTRTPSATPSKSPTPTDTPTDDPDPTPSETPCDGDGGDGGDGDAGGEQDGPGGDEDCDDPEPPPCDEDESCDDPELADQP